MCLGWAGLRSVLQEEQCHKEGDPPEEEAHYEVAPEAMTLLLGDGGRPQCDDYPQKQYESGPDDGQTKSQKVDYHYRSSLF